MKLKNNKLSKERLIMGLLTHEQLNSITPKQFGESQEYFDWKNGTKTQNGIVLRRLERLDHLLSCGQWISNTHMMEKINELYLDAPNEECYGSFTPPHRIIESKEGSRKKYESALSLMFAGTIRQDRLTIYRILRIVGKEHIFEKKDGEGKEGSYRYSTKYSIFDKYRFNNIPFDDYELSKSIPIVIDGLKTQFKTDQDKDTFLEEVSGHIENLDFPTTKALEMLSTVALALRRARDINNNYVSNLLDKVYCVYDTRQEGWEKELLNTLLNAYYVASHPDADFDIATLFQIRSMLILAKEINSDYGGIVSLLRKQQETLPLLASVPEGFDEASIRYLIKHFVFVTNDTNGMIYELEDYYNACANEGKIIMDDDLHFALKCLCFKSPEKWEYNSQLLSVINNLITFFLSVQESDFFVTSMLVSLFYLKLNIEATEKGEEPISEDDIVQLYVDFGWEHPKFQM